MDKKTLTRASKNGPCVIKDLKRIVEAITRNVKVDNPVVVFYR